MKPSIVCSRRSTTLAPPAAVHRRLQPGAPFFVAQHSFPNTSGEQDKWLRRNAALLVASGVPSAGAKENIVTMKERLPAISPQEDEAVLREAGFVDVELFYAGFTFKGWVAHRA